MSKLRYCFDIETNGFMPDVNKIWCMVLVNADTKEVQSFSDWDDDLPSLQEGLDELNRADIIFGHNVIGYDLVVLKHLRGWSPDPKIKVIDTWIMSQCNQYKRRHKHSLEGWGEQLGFNKIEFSEFDRYSKEMLVYCIRDVELNVKVYEKLVSEAMSIIKKNPLYKKGLDVEMEFAVIESEIRNKGWYFDHESAEELLERLVKRITEIETVMEPRIGLRCIAVDGKDEFKEPAWRKDGFYTVATVKHFGFTQESGREERPIEGPYCRITFEQGKLGSDLVVKDYLYSLGWKPDEWNYKKVPGKPPVMTGPKLTDSSLEPLGEDGKLISEYNTLTSRLGILKGWIEESKRDGRLHGRMWTIGTPTFRCRHEVVANLPSVESEWGPEMRSLLTCEPGYTIVGADSSGNQMRGLCHYIGNDEFTNEVVNGDVHQRNADVLGVSRKTAKPFLYAFLFGGGAGKLGLILSGVRDAKLGANALEKFQNSIPGMKELKESLESQYENTSNAFGKDWGYIRGLDGRLVFVASNHQLLNYLLQTAEGITCKAAIVYMKQALQREGITDFYFALHYHDEFAVVCKDEDAKRVAELAVEAFVEAPKWFGVQCMGGAAHIGKTYAEVH